eukprot:706413-Prymnesium_polylepis.1
MGDNESRLSEPWFGESLSRGLKPPDCTRTQTHMPQRLACNGTASTTACIGPSATGTYGVAHTSGN